MAKSNNAAMTRRVFLARTFALGLASSTVSPASRLLAQSTSEQPHRRPNVLFIAVDDLRPQLGCYGNDYMISPNIDQLSRQGILFERAYCQQPICMATRASLLSGYRPDHAHIYDCRSLQEDDPDALTINKWFEQNGYDIWATGKIYHYPQDHKAQFGKRWVRAKGGWVGRGYLSPQSIRQVKEYAKVYPTLRGRGHASDGRGPAFEAADVPDNAYEDGAQTDLAIAQLQKFKKSTNPFFMAVGFHKPHLPFNAPKKYWDMYDENKINLADNPFLPKNATEFTKYNFNELRNYYGIPKDEKPLPDDLARKLQHGYYACVTYTDAQIGRLLHELDRLDLRRNTIIVLWGDHGWKLGEHAMWCKHTPFELDAHAPLLFSVPGLASNGKRSRAFAEFVDIYPTLCELCGLKLPGHLQGDSLVPVLHNPQRKWKKAAFTQWPKIARRNPDKVITGYSIKTDRYRYTEWTRNKTGKVLARELYDHRIDSEENENIADYPKNKPIVSRLSKLLDGGKGWRWLRPKF